VEEVREVIASRQGEIGAVGRRTTLFWVTAGLGHRHSDTYKVRGGIEGGLGSEGGAGGHSKRARRGGCHR